VIATAPTRRSRGDQVATQPHDVRLYPPSVKHPWRGCEGSLRWRRHAWATGVREALRNRYKFRSTPAGGVKDGAATRSAKPILDTPSWCAMFPLSVAKGTCLRCCYVKLEIVWIVTRSRLRALSRLAPPAIAAAFRIADSALARSLDRGWSRAW